MIRGSYPHRGSSMSYVRVLACTALLAGLGMPGCTGDHITNVTEFPSAQGVTGRIVPGEAGTVVAAWQASEIKRAITDSAGYFAIADLPIGMYDIRIATPAGDTLTVVDIEVRNGATTSLGNVQMNGPRWPLVHVTPRDSAQGVEPLSPRISILSAERIDMLSLSSSVLFPGTGASSRATTIRSRRR